jgi:hypothetical protein
MNIVNVMNIVPRIVVLRCGFGQANGRCRMHGGASTGPRTVEGLARSQRARWKHGLYSADSLAEQKRVRELLSQSRELLKQMQAG